MVAMFVNGSGQNEQSLQRTFHRCFLPSFGSLGQVVLEKNFSNQPIRHKSRLWRPCLLTNREEMSNLYRGPNIYASYQVSVHLATVSGEELKNSANQKQESPVAAMFVNGSGQIEHSQNTTQVIIRHRICLRTDMVKPVYPLQLRCGGYKNRN